MRTYCEKGEEFVTIVIEARAVRQRRIASIYSHQLPARPPPHHTTNAGDTVSATSQGRGQGCAQAAARSGVWQGIGTVEAPAKSST